MDLHFLDHKTMPLFDGLSGALVPDELDARVDRLRDSLMDEARARVEDLGEDAVAGRVPETLELVGPLKSLIHLNPCDGLGQSARPILEGGYIHLKAGGEILGVQTDLFRSRSLQTQCEAWESVWRFWRTNSRSGVRLGDTRVYLEFVEGLFRQKCLQLAHRMGILI